MPGSPPVANARLALAHDLFLLAALAALCAILTAALILQLGFGELPCPLCLLERLAMFGAAFGILLNLRGPFSDRNTGITLIFALFLLVVAVRQTLLDIYPRPGHAYVGSAIFGLHMPVWSVVIALALLCAFAFRLAALGGDAHIRGRYLADRPVLHRAATAIGVWLLALAAANCVGVLLQCGLGECHTTGYALLGAASDR